MATTILQANLAVVRARCSRLERKRVGAHKLLEELDNERAARSDLKEI